MKWLLTLFYCSAVRLINIPITGTKQGLCDLRGNILLRQLRASAFSWTRSCIYRLSWYRKTAELWPHDKPRTLPKNPGTVPRPHPRAKQLSRTNATWWSTRIYLLWTDWWQIDPKYWGTGRLPIKMMLMFNRFLHEYDPIGTPESDLLKLLGEGSYVCPSRETQRRSLLQISVIRMHSLCLWIKNKTQKRKGSKLVIFHKCSSYNESEELPLSPQTSFWNCLQNSPNGGRIIAQRIGDAHLKCSPQQFLNTSVKPGHRSLMMPDRRRNYKNWRWQRNLPHQIPRCFLPAPTFYVPPSGTTETSEATGG